MLSMFKPATAGVGFACLLVACSQAPEAGATTNEAVAQGSTSVISEAQAITVDAVVPVRAEPIEDQLITCSATSSNGNTLKNFFVLSGGEAKSYSSFQNYARNLCEVGQPDCAQGWIGDKIASYSVNRNGVRNQLLVDVDALAMERAVTLRDGTVEVTQYQCTSEPLPDGITID